MAEAADRRRWRFRRTLTLTGNVTRDIEALHPDNDLPTGIWSDGETLWVLENSAGGADLVFAYELATGERREAREFVLDRRNRFAHGIWSDGEIVWIADSGQDLLFAYRLATGERLEGRDIGLGERNRDPRGIWSDGEALYVLDSVKDAVFVYDVETGELGAQYALDKLNQSPRGIWSDGLTLWVSDDGANRIFAYRIENETLNRYEDEEFTFRSLLKAGNGDARGIWSDGDVIYVVDEQDDQVYSYNIPDAIQARLRALSLSALELGGFPRRSAGLSGRGASRDRVHDDRGQRHPGRGDGRDRPGRRRRRRTRTPGQAGCRDDDQHHGDIRGRQPQPDLHDRGAPTVHVCRA